MRPLPPLRNSNILRAYGARLAVQLLEALRCMHMRMHSFIVTQGLLTVLTNSSSVVGPGTAVVERVPNPVIASTRA